MTDRHLRDSMQAASASWKNLQILKDVWKHLQTLKASWKTYRSWKLSKAWMRGSLNRLRSLYKLISDCIKKIMKTNHGQLWFFRIQLLLQTFPYEQCLLIWSVFSLRSRFYINRSQHINDSCPFLIYAFSSFFHFLQHTPKTKPFPQKGYSPKQNRNLPTRTNWPSQFYLLLCCPNNSAMSTAL